MTEARKRAIALLAATRQRPNEGLKLSELSAAIRQQNLATKSLAYAAAMDQALAKLIDVIGDRYVEEVDHEAVEIFQITLGQWVASKSGAHQKRGMRSTIDAYVRRLRTAFNAAVKLGHINRNPFRP